MTAATDSFRPVVVAPTFNNARTLPDILRALETVEIPVIVVNDGSTDQTANIVALFERPGSLLPGRTLTHPENLGKAAALQSGFNLARELDFTHAITIDTDGQHDVSDIAPLLALAQKVPTALIVGHRCSSTPGYPLGSRIGRSISNFFVRLESGVRVHDSQCGLRVYPLDSIAQIKSHTRRFGYETEILTRAAWAGVPILEAPVRCIYDVAGGRTTHFRPLIDSLFASAMHVRLLARSLAPWPVKKTFPQRDNTHIGTLAERFGRWMNPMRVWRQIRHDPVERERFAASMAAGIFMATFPAYGIKTILCLLIAKFFRLQPPVVVGVSQLSTPPTGAILAAISIAAGHLLLRGTWPNLGNYDPFANGFLHTLKQIGVEWILGSLLVGLTLAAITYLLARLAMRSMPRAKAI